MPLNRDAADAVGWDFLDSARKKGEDDGLIPFKPTSSSVGEFISALKSLCPLDSNLDPPFWIGDRRGKPTPKECLVVANGILHLPTGTLLEPTPRLFTLSASTVSYDRDAKCPQWDELLSDVFEDDEPSATLLQDMAGYFTTQDTSFEKLFAIIGPRRACKGTFATVFEHLVGEDSVTSPTIGQLSTGNAGRQCLIGKPLAVIRDARFGSSRNPDSVTELLLSISGRDKINITRKYLDDWEGRLPTKFMIVSNEMPRFKDTSGVVISRFMVLKLRKSYAGREDRTLFEKKLKPELSGILNWAVRGYQRLYERGYFVQPDSASDTIRNMEDLASPVMAFVRDWCDLDDAHSIRTDQLYGPYVTWCGNQNHNPTSSNVFGANLAAAFPEIKKVRRRAEGKQVWNYAGIELKKDIPYDDDPNT